MLEMFIDVHNSSWDDGMTESFEHGKNMERTARLDLIKIGPLILIQCIWIIETNIWGWVHVVGHWHVNMLQVVHSVHFPEKRLLLIHFMTSSLSASDTIW